MIINVVKHSMAINIIYHTLILLEGVIFYYLALEINLLDYGKLVQVFVRKLI